MAARSVQPTTLRHKRAFYQLYLRWEAASKRAPPRTTNAADVDLAAYLDALYPEGAPSDEAEKTVAAFRFLTRSSAGDPLLLCRTPRRRSAVSDEPNRRPRFCPCRSTSQRGLLFG